MADVASETETESRRHFSSHSSPRHPLLVIHSREFLSFVTSWNISEC